MTRPTPRKPAAPRNGGVATLAPEVPWVRSLATLQPPEWTEQAHRQKALRRFEALGLPTPRHEEWRWFPVGHLSKVDFEQATEAAVVAESALSTAMVTDLGGPRLVFVDGILAPEFTRGDVPGLTLESLVASDGATSIDPEGPDAERPFVALNEAFSADGAHLRVTRGYEDGAPVHLLFVSTRADAPRVSHPRVVIEVASGAQLHVVQEHLGWATHACLTNVVIDATVAAGGRLHFTKLSHESESTTHVARLAVQQERDSFFQAHCFGWNAGHTRNDVEVRLDGEGASCELHGLIYLKGRQIADDHTWIHHLQPHTTSVERYRAVLDDESRGAFSGAIHVATGAQQTNSQQTSRNLLLSDRALMNTKPELQILADDVKCSHGATIGQLDAAALFFLRSRGIGKQEAIRMLTLAFGRAVVDRVPLEAVRAGLRQQLFGETNDVS